MPLREIATSVMPNSLATKVVAAGVGGAALFGLGLWHGMMDRIDVAESADGGRGTIEDVYTLPPKECHGGYDVMIEGARGRLHVEADLKIYTQELLDAHMTFNGKMTAEVCNASDPELAQAQLEITTENGERKIEATIAPEALTTTVYATNPEQVVNVWGGNVVTMAGDTFANIVKALPGDLDIRSMDKMQSRLAGLAFLAAAKTTSEACGPQAWELLREPYAQQVAEGIVAHYNVDREHPISIDDVTVNVPEADQVKFTTQYTDQLNDKKEEMEKQNISWSAPDVSESDCEAAPNIQVEDRSE